MSDNATISDSCRRCYSQPHCLPRGHACPARLHAVTNGRQGDANGRGLHSEKIGRRVQVETRRQAAQDRHDAILRRFVPRETGEAVAAAVDVLAGFR